jgi:hypothetical protein
MVHAGESPISPPRSIAFASTRPNPTMTVRDPWSETSISMREKQSPSGSGLSNDQTRGFLITDRPSPVTIPERLRPLVTKKMPGGLLERWGAPPRREIGARRRSMGAVKS